MAVTPLSVLLQIPLASQQMVIGEEIMETIMEFPQTDLNGLLEVFIPQVEPLMTKVLREKLTETVKEVLELLLYCCHLGCTS